MFVVFCVCVCVCVCACVRVGFSFKHSVCIHIFVVYLFSVAVTCDQLLVSLIFTYFYMHASFLCLLLCHVDCCL